ERAQVGDTRVAGELEVARPGCRLHDRRACGADRHWHCQRSDDERGKGQQTCVLRRHGHLLSRPRSAAQAERAAVESILGSRLSGVVRASAEAPTNGSVPPRKRFADELDRHPKLACYVVASCLLSSGICACEAKPRRRTATAVKGRPGAS